MNKATYKTPSAPARQRFCITAALPYINGIKHLGNVVGSMLPADVHARFRTLQGHEVLFICATDEHGTPAELAAQEAGEGVRAYCDRMHGVQRRLCEGFLMSFSHFGRSSSPENRELTQHFADRLEDAGLIEERSSVGLYSLDDRRFLPDRYVEGTCPRCGYDGARGDQCDACSALLEPTDLIRPRSRISGSERIERRTTKHLYLLQTRVADRVRTWVGKARGWTKSAKAIANGWIDEGIQDRSITRDLSWGVPVTRNGRPRPGMEDKVFYVWFDAPICYIAASVEWAWARGGSWERWWRTDRGAEDVTYLQFMGKDNVAFHAVSFPATVLGSGEPWKTVDRIKSFEWLTWYGGKFSTSQKRGIFMDTALEVFPADVWRWALMANCPETSDTAFTIGLLQAAINSDLANNIGNYVQRITSFCCSAFGGAVPEGGTPGAGEERLYEEIDGKLAALTAAHEGMEFRKAVAETRALWSAGNAYLAAAAPWKTVKSDRSAAAMATRTGLALMLFLAKVSEPFLPDTARRIALLLPGEAACGGWPAGRAMDILAWLPPGATVVQSEPLFPKLDDAAAAALAARFGAPSAS